MNSSTGVEHSVAFGAEHKSIWCYSGIDLFVSLQIESTESTCVDSLSPWASSDAPRLEQLYPHTSVAPPADAVEDSSIIARTFHSGEQLEISLEDFAARSRTVEESSVTHFPPDELDELDGEVVHRKCGALAHTRGEQIGGQGKQSGRVKPWRSVPGVAVRRYITKFISPSAYQRDEHRCLNNLAQTSTVTSLGREWNNQPDKRSSEDDHEKVRGVESQCEISSRRNVGRGCLAVNHNLGDLNSVSQEDLEETPKDRTRRNEEFNSCNENRSWSPQVEDYPCLPVDMSRDPANLLTRCSEGITDVGEDLDQNFSKMPSSVISENDVVGRILQREHIANPSLDALVHSKTPVDVENFDVARILAACQLVKMSAFDSRKDFSEQELSCMERNDVNNLEFRGESNENSLSKVVENMYRSLPDIDVSNTGNSLQPGVGKFDLSPWSDEDRYIPRIARRARGRLRGSQFNTRIDFGNTEVDEDTDCEVLHRPPRKRRQYKSTRELLLA